MHINEVKEFAEGHHDLGARVSHDSVRKIAMRHVLRLMSDVYGKGIVRGQAENVNLRAYAKENSVIAAGSVSTAQTKAFHGRTF